MDGEQVVIVEAWTSIWDDILGKSTPSLSIQNAQETVDKIYYCSNRDEKNMTIIYGSSASSSESVVVLPRLVMGYYFYLAAILLAVFGLAWLILRKKKKASAICMYFFLAPLSYLIAHVLLGEDYVSYSAQRDFIMVIIAAAIIYGICLYGCMLLVQYRRDKQ